MNEPNDTRPDYDANKPPRVRLKPGPKPGSGAGGARPGAGRPKKTVVPPPAELVEALRGAKTARALDAAAAGLSAALLDGKVDRLAGEAALSVLKERRQLLKAKREEKGKRQVRRLEILTPAEEALLLEHRAKLAGPAMKPGEMAPPPVSPNERKTCGKPSTIGAVPHPCTLDAGHAGACIAQRKPE